MKLYGVRKRKLFEDLIRGNEMEIFQWNGWEN